MDPWEVLAIALGLAMDAFAVSLAAGAHRDVAGGRATFRLAFHFGLFQALMPVVGWAAGVSLLVYLAPFDHWVAFGLLAFVGALMLTAAWLGRGDGAAPSVDPSRGAILILLSVATSRDALAVGLSLAALQVDVWLPALTIGLVTGILCVLSVGVGARLGARWGRAMEALGGLLLIAISLRILLQHLAV